MLYTCYCFGLAAQAVDSELPEEAAAAYAIGSLDRLHKVKLPRCRKEVEDAIAALSDPNYVTMTQQWQERCDRLQAERDNYHSLLDAAEEARKNPPIVVDGDAFMQMKKDEFDRGYKAGYEGSAYSPTSLSYIEGYESGELAAMRAGKRRI